MSRCGYHSLFYILFAWILAACGGGGGGGGVDASDGNIGGSTSTLTVTLTVTDQNDATVLPPYTISDGNPLFITATIRNGNTASASTNVSFTTDVGVLNAESRITDSTGTTSKVRLSAGTTGTIKTGILRVTAITGGAVGAGSLNFESLENATDVPDGETSFTTAINFTDGSNNDLDSTIPFGSTATINITTTPAQAEGTVVSISSLVDDGSGTSLGQLSSNQVQLDNSGAASFTLDSRSQSGNGVLTLIINGETFTRNFTIPDPIVLLGYANAANVIQEQKILVNTLTDNDDGDNDPSTVTLRSLGSAVLSSFLFIEDTAGNYTNSSGDTFSLYSNTGQINFTSPCAADNSKSTLSYSTADNNIFNGKTTATYKVNTCQSDETITATTVINDVTFQATADVTITPSTASRIEFLSVDTGEEGVTTLALAGTPSNNLQESADITFVVKGSDNNPISGQKVFFDVSSRLGGITLDTDNATPPYQISDSSDEKLGQVTVRVTSGNIPTDVSIVAILEDPTDPDCNDDDTLDTGACNNIRAFSTVLTIGTGFPHQRAFSLAATNFTPRGFGYQGVEVGLTVRASDLNQNAVPNDTPINFWSEIGSGQLINPNTSNSSSCLINSGACSINWISDPFDSAQSNYPDVTRAIDQFTNFDGDSSVMDNDGYNINSANISTAHFSNGDFMWNRIIEALDFLRLRSWTYDIGSNGSTETVSVTVSNSSVFSFGNNLNIDLTSDTDVGAGNAITAATLRADAIANRNSLGGIFSSNTRLDISGSNAASQTINLTVTDAADSANTETITRTLCQLLTIDTSVPVPNTPDPIPAATCTASNLQNLQFNTIPLSSYLFNPNDRYGIIEIQAYTTGVESFTDANGNGLFDGDVVAEEVGELGEAFIDANQNGSYDSEAGLNLERFVDFNNGTGSDGVYNAPETGNNIIYNGLTCSTTAKNNGHCPDNNQLVTVRNSVTLYSTTDSARIFAFPNGTDISFIDARDTSGLYRPLNGYRGMLTGFRKPVTDNGITVNDGTLPLLSRINMTNLGDTSYTFPVYISDQNGNPLPAGTTISVSGPSPASAKLSFPTQDITVGSSSSYYLLNVTITADPGASDPSGSLTIEVTTPGESGNDNISDVTSSYTLTIDR